MENRIIKKKLLYKLLIFILPLLILSIALTSIILSWTSYNYFLKTVDQDYRNIIKSSTGEIRQYMENAQKALESLALAISATKPDIWQKEMAMTAFVHITEKFMSVSLISLEGEKILSTGQEGERIDFSQDETFDEARAGYDAMSGLKRTKENIPYIDIAVPVLHLGEVKEILWGELNIKSIWDVIEGIHVGETGQVFIMDLSGRLVGHREMDRVVNASLIAKQEVLKTLHEPDMLMQWVEERDGERLYCVGQYLPALDWIVVLSQSYREIHAYLYQSIFWATVVTCLICLLAILFGWNRVKRFLIPIKDLHHQVQKIGKGDLDQKVAVESEDEIGDLALAFNEMSDSLKRFIDREVKTAKELVHAKNLAVLGTTSSKVTHEIGNFLNNLGLTITLFRNEKLSPKGERVLAILDKEALRIRGFIENFLKFAKVPELHLERTSLENIIRETLILQQPEADKRDVHFEFNWPSNLPFIHVDPHLIYQIFSNLIKNSLEAMISPGNIRIEGMTDGNYLQIILSDTGSGIESDVMKQIFDPFFTTKGKQGTGLGLSIVKTIVEAHRGTIECQSQIQKGTTFTLSFPLQ